MTAFLLPFALLLSFATATPEALLSDADRAREAGRTDQAIALYRRALQQKPAATEAWWYLGLCLSDKDQFAEAAAAFAKVTEAQPKQGAGWAMLGVSLKGAKQYDRALAALSRAHALGVPAVNDLDKVARYHYAALLSRAGTFDQASTLLMMFVTSNAVTPRVTQAAGLAALRLRFLPEEIPQDLAEPVRLAGEASILGWQKRTADARSVAATLLQRSPDLANAHYLMGYLLLLDNDPACLDEFRRELARDPRHVPAMLQLASELLRRSDLPPALDYARQAVRAEPGNFIAHNLLGRILLGMDHVPEATRELETAVRLEPGSPEAHFHLAGAYARSGRKDDAAKQRAIFAQLDRERKN